MLATAFSEQDVSSPRQWSHHGPAKRNARKRAKEVFLHAAKVVGAFALARRLTSRAVRILCYHGVWLAEDGFPGDAMFLRPETFERRLGLIRQYGYAVVSVDQAIAALYGGASVPPAAVAITIDDGWYSTYKMMIPALERYRMPATLYCDTAHLLSREPVAHLMAQYLVRLAPGSAGSPAVQAILAKAVDRDRPMAERLAATRELSGLVGVDLALYLDAKVFDYMSPEQLASVADRGLDVQLHTHRHTLGDLTTREISREIGDNRVALAAILNRPATAFTHFCYPSGVASEAAAQSLADLGLNSSTTTEQGIAWPSSPRHLIPRILDRESASDLEFEAELTGFADALRWMARLVGVRPGSHAGA